MRSLRALVFLTVLFALASAAAEHFKLKLPGTSKLDIDFALDAGYIPVNNSSQRHLFYVFAESRKKPVENQPLVLWLNGGPGCSSMKGFFMGNGPFFPQSDGTLRSNRFTWNNIANVLYVDSPAGVGFSYSENMQDLEDISDARTASDLRIFLLEFLKQYPQYKQSELWLTSQSYGGHYVPVLAEEILKHNEGKDSSHGEYLNLKGVMIGNPLIDTAINMPFALQQWEVNAVIPHGTFDALNAACNFSDSEFYIKMMMGQNMVCLDLLMQQLQYIEGIDIYDLFRDTCIEKAQDTDLCVISHLREYMNEPKVQEAFKVRKTVEWTDCFDINYSLDQYRSSLPSIQTMIDKKLKIMIYSGDVDGSTPYWTTVAALEELGLAVEEPMKVYRFNGQVAGRIVKYKGLSLVTVRNAGHLVPWTQTERAYLIYSKFLTSGSIPEDASTDDLENVKSSSVKVGASVMLVGALLALLI